MPYNNPKRLDAQSLTEEKTAQNIDVEKEEALCQQAARTEIPSCNSGRTILVSSISSDSHTWNLVFLQLLIEEYGHKVINLGSCVPIDLLLDTCKRRKPDMVVISSVNGHGHIEGHQIIQALRQEPALQHLTAVIGGKLGTRGVDNAVYTTPLLEAGFDAVFDADSGLSSFTQLLTTPQPHQLGSL